MEKIKLNLGCGGRPLRNYTNIDLDNLKNLKLRYPNTKFDDNLIIKNYDIFNLPYDDNTVHEVRADSFIEHLSFIEEKKLFLEIQRILVPKGIFSWSVPDFEDCVKKWLKAEDNWQDFFRDDDEAISQNHWFGTFTYNQTNRWGYLTAMIFGSQKGEGQFHKNAYTEGKIRAMMKKINFEISELYRFNWKEDRDLMIQVISRKNYE